MTIEIRTLAGAGVEELRAEVAAFLASYPYKANACGCDNARRPSRWGKGSRSCTKIPSVAVERVSSAEALSNQYMHDMRFQLVCAAHAHRYLDKRTIVVRADVLKEARAQAARNRKRRDEEEDKRRTAEALTRACPFCKADAGAPCMQPASSVLAARPIDWTHAHRQGDA